MTWHNRSLLVLALGMLGAGVPLATAGADGPGPLRPTVLGNPTISSVSAPAPVGQVGATTPSQVPKGPTPATHVYVKAGGGSSVSFAAMEFTVPTGTRQPKLVLSLEDDAGPAQDVNAADAPLFACVMPSAMFASDPDGPVNYDCTLPARGVRKVDAVGGTWTFDVSGLASTVDRSGRFGLAVVSAPEAASAFSVAVLRSSVRLIVDSSSPTQEPASSDGADRPTPATGGSRGVLPGTPTGIARSAALLPGITAPSTPDALAPSVALAPDNAPQGLVLAAPTRIVPAGSTSSSTRRWRPLLLLLVPLVPVVGLAWFRRIDPDDDDPAALAERYPGLASLRS